MPSNDLVCPVTGEVFEEDDPEHLINAYEQYKLIKKRVDNFGNRIKAAMVNLTSEIDDSIRTRRLFSESGRVAVITMPDDAWNKKLLRDIWSRYPKFAPNYLAIEAVRVQMREWNKLFKPSPKGGKVLAAKVPAGLRTFIGEVRAANNGPAGSASVKIEEAKS